MKKEKLYIVRAFDPDDQDGFGFVVGNFFNKDEAKKAKKKYEYTTQTGCKKAEVIVEEIYNNYNEANYDSSIIGYYAFLKDDKTFTLIRDRVAYEEYENDLEVTSVLKELFDEYNDDVNAVMINNIAYTEVPYNDNDEIMEKEAFNKINSFLKSNC